MAEFANVGDFCPNYEKLNKNLGCNIIGFGHTRSGRERLKNENGGVQKWTLRTPVMAAGMTEHASMLKELFRTVVIGRQRSTG
ncbi:MAG: hypothetical protein D3924_12360 [Candidatus Electrothrix sp. AR4]|nr:hypothetical protein [Candidatus Electrothrix sp. AR4]